MIATRPLARSQVQGFFGKKKQRAQYNREEEI